MTTQQAYIYQMERLTHDQQMGVNRQEGLIGRKLTPWELTLIFKLEPVEKRTTKRRLSDEINDRWMDE